MATILIVEDEIAVLVLAESVLQSNGHDTLSASTLAQAQAIIHSDQKFDLIFTDISLADQKEGGLQVGQTAIQARVRIPVLYTSGMALTDGMKALFSEPSEFLPKPYRDDELVTASSDCSAQVSGTSKFLPESEICWLT